MNENEKKIVDSFLKSIADADNNSDRHELVQCYLKFLETILLRKNIDAFQDASQQDVAEIERQLAELQAWRSRFTNQTISLGINPTTTKTHSVGPQIDEKFPCDD